MKKYIIAAILLAIALTFGINEYFNRNVGLTEYTYENAAVTKAFDGFRIMVIADIHNAPFEGHITDIIRRENPDLIAFCGDMVQLPDDKTTAARAIGDRFGKKCDILAVSGNHETQNRSYRTIVSELEEHNIRVIDNECIDIERGGEKILLAGAKDPKNDYITTQQYDKVNKTVRSFFDERPELKILLNHRANMYPMINGSGADLIVSGHMHGGVIKMPFLGGIIGEGGWLPDYAYGFYDGGEKSDMIVSGGCDRNPKKKRFFNPPEVVIITLKSE